MGHLLSCRDCLVAVERYKIWDISCHARTALWLWRGTRYGHLLSCKDCPHQCTLKDLWLANEKGTDVAQYWAKNL
jgi:hypothetical protein